MVNYKIFTQGSFQPPIRPSFGLLYFKTNICAYVFFLEKNSFFWEKKLSLKLIFAWLICNIVSKFQYLMSPLKHFQNTRKGHGSAHGVEVGHPGAASRGQPATCQPGAIAGVTRPRGRYISAAEPSATGRPGRVRSYETWLASSKENSKQMVNLWDYLSTLV